MLKADGPRSTLRYAGMRLLRPALLPLIEQFYDRRLGVSTREGASLEELGIDDPDALYYTPISYPAFFRAMKHVPATGAFVDYGSGLGRVLVAAATFPFHRVLGVELSPDLVTRSLRNIASAKRTNCSNIEVICANATHWTVPADVTVFHFFNPFVRQTLRTVVANIAQSLRAQPRQAWIMFANPWDMSLIMRSGEIIPQAWQMRSIDVLWPLAQTRKDPDGSRYRIYALDSRTGSTT